MQYNIEQIKREVDQSMTEYRHYRDNRDMARSIVNKTIDYLHSRGYLGGVWQPIETIPNDRRILCTNGLEEHVCIQYANGVFSHGCYIPTHWMPLPKPPEETK